MATKREIDIKLMMMQHIDKLNSIEDIHDY